jgi:AraC-like DNA-binding protein
MCGEWRIHHDRNTAIDDRGPGVVEMTTVSAGEAGGPQPTALLHSALEQLRLEGAIFFRSEFTEGFAIESKICDVASGLHAGADRLILFHIVAGGSCWVSGPENERHWAHEGDVIVVPYGDTHTIGGASAAEPVSILALIEPPPWSSIPVVRHGGGGERTDIVCGYLHSEDPLFDPVMAVFPSVFVVRLPPGPATSWVQASIAYALEASAPSVGAHTLVSTRLPELVLIEILRLHLATAPAANRGWVAALRDPVLAPALSLLHRSPAHRWTVAELAAGASVSRSLLDERFRQVLGRSPIRYLTEWRMHLAEELLTDTAMSVIAVARHVGYDSEEAFSRAFKRDHHLSPTRWRAAQVNQYNTVASDR